MLQSGVAPSAAIQPDQCGVEGSALLLSIGFVQFPQFPCSIYFNRKETDGLDCGAEASMVPPIIPSWFCMWWGGFLCLRFVVIVLGFFSFWVAGGWRNTRVQVLLKPEGWFCFGGKDNFAPTFLILRGMFQERI